jgi:hypothetical protein
MRRFGGVLCPAELVTQLGAWRMALCCWQGLNACVIHKRWWCACDRSVSLDACCVEATQVENICCFLPACRRAFSAEQGPLLCNYFISRPTDLASCLAATRPYRRRILCCCQGLQPAMQLLPRRPSSVQHVGHPGAKVGCGRSPRTPMISPSKPETPAAAADRSTPPHLPPHAGACRRAPCARSSQQRPACA